MKKEIIEKVHISRLRIGDVIKHNGYFRTIGKDDIKFSSFMATTVFGDSYRLGKRLVTRKYFIEC